MPRNRHSDSEHQLLCIRETRGVSSADTQACCSDGSDSFSVTVVAPCTTLGQQSWNEGVTSAAWGGVLRDVQDQLSLAHRCHVDAAITAVTALQCCCSPLKRACPATASDPASWPGYGATASLDTIHSATSSPCRGGRLGLPLPSLKCSATLTQQAIGSLTWPSSALSLMAAGLEEPWRVALARGKEELCVLIGAIERETERRR